MQAYIDLLNFYVAILEILSSKVFSLAMLDLENRLPTITSDFAEHVKNLRSYLDNEQLRIVKQIEDLLIENKSERS